MRTRALCVVGIIAVAMGSLGIAEAKQGEDAKTKVKLALSYFPESQSRNYQAILKSKDDECLEGRDVTFFEELDGADEKIATEISNEFGSAFFTDSPAPAFEPGERFYAKVKKSDGCKKGKSKVFEVGPGTRAEPRRGPSEAIAPRAHLRARRRNHHLRAYDQLQTGNGSTPTTAMISSQVEVPGLPRRSRSTARRRRRTRRSARTSFPTSSRPARILLGRRGLHAAERHLLRRREEDQEVQEGGLERDDLQRRARPARRTPCDPARMSAARSRAASGP